MASCNEYATHGIRVGRHWETIPRLATFNEFVDSPRLLSLDTDRFRSLAC